MFSGKTSELVRRAQPYRFIQKAGILLFKPHFDTRHGEGSPIVRTHSGMNIDFAHKQELISCGEDIIQRAMKWREANSDYDHLLILVDEGQFVRNLRAAAEWATKQSDFNATMIIAALDGDYHRKMFPSIVEVLPLCSQVSKFRAICMDCKKRTAPYTRIRISPQEDTQCIVGGVEKYAACCATCYEAK